MSQSVYDLKDSTLDEKILRDFHFNAPEINESLNGKLPSITNKAKIFIQTNLQEQDSFFRFGVSGGGCSGYNYIMDEDTKINEDDVD